MGESNREPIESMRDALDLIERLDEQWDIVFKWLRDESINDEKGN
jgi:hypothetical protein